MKKLHLFPVLILVAAALHAQTPSQTPLTQQTPASLSATRIFSSGWNFDLVYPSDWNVQDLKPILPLMKLESETRKNCAQRLFNAKLGVPASDFSIVGQTIECLGHELKLSDLALGTMTALNKEFHLSNTEYGAYSIGSLSFWVMRTRAAKIDHPDDVIILEKVITVLPKGVIYLSAFCKDEMAQKEFEHSHFHLANGDDSELIPADAFQGAAASMAIPQEKK